MDEDNININSFACEMYRSRGVATVLGGPTLEHEPTPQILWRSRKERKQGGSSSAFARAIGLLSGLKSTETASIPAYPRCLSPPNDRTSYQPVSPTSSTFL